jgi:hypothetical protein
MKRTNLTAILLGTLALLFFSPFAILFLDVITLVLNRPTPGITAGAGGFGFFGFGIRKALLVLGLVVGLPIVVSLIRRKILRGRG